MTVRIISSSLYTAVAADRKCCFQCKQTTQKVSADVPQSPHSLMNDVIDSVNDEEVDKDIEGNK